MKRLFILLLILTPVVLRAQWQPSGATTGNIYYNNGNVGIGRSSPLSKLDVNGNIQISNSANYPMGVITEVDATMALLNLSLNFREPNKNTAYKGGAFRIDSRDGVPLFQWISRDAGTVNERELLALQKNQLFIHNDLYINSEVDDNHIYWGNHYMTMGTKKGDYSHNILKLSPGGSSNGLLFSCLQMYNANSETSFDKRVQIHTNDVTFFNGGNVGIGTTDPDAKLAVKGNIHAQEVRVDLSGSVAPDYVFEKEYELLALPELAKYIQMNKHLPDVPSASEMDKDGINLKEMNLMLLKKIEELTLYMLQQEERIKKLESTVK